VFVAMNWWDSWGPLLNPTIGIFVTCKALAVVLLVRKLRREYLMTDTSLT
jgi:hypothetical protein